MNKKIPSADNLDSRIITQSPLMILLDLLRVPSSEPSYP